MTAAGAAGQVVAAHQVDPPKETRSPGATAEIMIRKVCRGVSQAFTEIIECVDRAAA